MMIQNLNERMGKQVGGIGCPVPVSNEAINEGDVEHYVRQIFKGFEFSQKLLRSVGL
jgi:hypothetical protein